MKPRSDGGLEPRSGQTFAGPVAVVNFAIKMGKHDFVREEGNPFKGGRAVGIRAANEFVPAVTMPDQAGVAKLTDHPAAALREDVFQFHTRSPYALGWDNGGPGQIIIGSMYLKQIGSRGDQTS